MPDHLFAHRLEEAWRRLVTLNADRADRERSIVEAYEAARIKAERDHRKTVEEAQKRHDLRARRLRAEHGRAREKIVTRFTALIDKADRSREMEVDLIRHKARNSDKEARKQLDEAIWLAESVYEASEDQPAMRYDVDLKTLAGKLAELDGIEQEAVTWLGRCRLPRLPEATAERELPAAAPPDDEAVGSEAPDPSQIMDEPLDESRAVLDAMKARRIPRLFPGIRFPALVIVIAVAAAAVVAWRSEWQLTGRVGIAAGAAAAATILAGVVLYWLARRGVAPETETLARRIAEARLAHDVAAEQAALNRDAWTHRITGARDTEISAAQAKYGPIIDEIAERERHHLDRINRKYPEYVTEREQERDEKLEAIDARGQVRSERIERSLEAAKHQADERRAAALDACETTRDTDWGDLLRTWNEGATEIAAVLEEAGEISDRYFRPWSDPSWAAWRPPTAFAPAVRFGELDVDVEKLEGGLPESDELIVPWATRFTLPAAFDFPRQCSLFLEHDAEGGESAIATLQLVMFRLLTAMPPGKVRFTILDPVGLGQNFAGFMHLTDHLEALVTDRIWTETRHIEQRLADLTDHMENVIQKYLRNEYETIAEYNEQAGEIAEPIRFLVTANFPVNFSEVAARRLASIASSGARCGVFMLIAHDTRQAIPKGLEVEDLHRNSLHLAHGDGRWTWRSSAFETLPLTLDEPPTPEFMIPRLHLVGEAAKDSSRVEVPFTTVAPADDARWTRSSAGDVKVPLGRCGATSLQELELGHGTSQHVLIAGKTGSGKSTLLHVLITNLALWYGPEEIELYLVDFKKGVEFKAYATHKLPHARAVAIESDREFGLSVLERLDRELKRRGDLFRTHGVQDLAAYRRGGGAETIPRTLLIIDEFQELFVEDDKIAQEAALLLDRLVRQGRAFGIHVVLGSQTLGGAYSLAKSTMGQMAVRIALQCSETDSYLIMSEDNAAARLLSRPGEAIYNDASGLVEGNSPFQIVWLSDLERERYIREVADRARAAGWRSPEPTIVFEGNVPADVATNRPLADLLDRGAIPPGPPRVWLGEAVAIKDPTAAVFPRQSGSNLLVVGQRDEAASAMFSVAGVAIGALAAADGEAPKLDVLDGSTPGSSLEGRLEHALADLPVDTRFIGRRDLGAALQDLVEDVDRRQAGAGSDAPSRFLMVFGLQRFRDLRQSDSYGFSFSEDEDKPPSPDKLFHRVLQEGPTVGIHTIIWCDTAANLDRCFDRQLLREFDMRVVFQMSATDSTNLIDSPRANKLGLRHAIFYSEEQGAEEKFRPYGAPDEGWLEETNRKLRIGTRQ